MQVAMKKKLDIDPSYYYALSNFFSPHVLGMLEKYNHSPYFKEVCINSGIYKQVDPEISLGKFLDLVYDFLSKNYRNEYIYKNIITRRELLSNHSVEDSMVLTEFRIGRSKADIMVLNGSSTIYEIKSEFDSFNRLEKQISNYLQAVDYVNVVVSQNHLEELKKILPNKIGIMVLEKGDTITTFREAKSNMMNIDKRILFESLRKKEYTEVIQSFYGKITKVPNTQYFTECKNMFVNIPTQEVHELTMVALKKRSNIKMISQYLKSAPISLTAYTTSTGGDEKKLKKMLSMLDNKICTYITA